MYPLEQPHYQANYFSFFYFSCSRLISAARRERKKKKTIIKIFSTSLGSFSTGRRLGNKEACRNIRLVAPFSFLVPPSPVDSCVYQDARLLHLSKSKVAAVTDCSELGNDTLDAGVRLSRTPHTLLSSFKSSIDIAYPRRRLAVATGTHEAAHAVVGGDHIHGKGTLCHPRTPRGRTLTTYTRRQLPLVSALCSIVAGPV